MATPHDREWKRRGRGLRGPFVVWIVLACLSVGMAIIGLVSAADVKDGTPGLLRVTYCQYDGGPRSARSRDTECHGVFRSTDGRVTDRLASVLGGPHRVGSEVAVRRLGFRDYQRILTAGQVRRGLIASLAVLVLGVTVFGGLALRAWLRMRTAPPEPAPVTVPARYVPPPSSVPAAPHQPPPAS
jgi:hypothetical protein